MYVKFFKRFFDFIFSLIAVVVLSPVLLALIIVGAVAMRGNRNAVLFFLIVVIKVQVLTHGI